MLCARMFDRYVEDFLATHPRGTVVEIGCGLDTGFDRVDDGRVRWFDLDLPDAVALRWRFFDDEPRRPWSPRRSSTARGRTRWRQRVVRECSSPRRC